MSIHVRVFQNAQGATKLREKIEPNEQATKIPEPVQKGVHVAKKASGKHLPKNSGVHVVLCY